MAADGPLLEVRTTTAVRTVPLTASTYRLGRHPDNDIVVSSPAVSRFHLVLEQQDGGYRLEDTSTNGTFQGGRRVSTIQLAAKTELQIGEAAKGGVRLVYRPAGTAPTTAPLFPPLALVGRTSVVVGRGPSCDLRLTDPLCSARHAVVERGADGTLAVRDLGSFNGTLLNGVAVQRAPLPPHSLLQFGNTRVIFDGYQLVWTSGSGMRIDARDLVRVGEQGKRLLDGVSFSVWPGEFVALLGVSGAGKSTLVDALNGLRPANEGKLRFNGVSFYRHREAFRNEIGYVPQDDIIHRELTVERALWHAARLRMPAGVPAADLLARLDTVLDEVGLAERRDAPIGRLSGGQRKRVSIAVELLTRPSLLLLDEPTSGLDPGLDKQMMTLLDRLAAEGQTVLVVTHAVGNIDLCDQVLFLANGGRLAFFGNPKEARGYFRTGDFAEIYRAVETQHDPTWWREQFNASAYCRNNVDARLQAMPDDTAPRPSGQTAATPRRHSAWRHFAVLAQRYLEIIRRDRGNLAFLLGQAPVVALMLWLVADPRALIDPAKPIDSHKLLFLMACAAAWFGIINSVREIVKELAVFRREHNIGVGIGPYVASKFAVLSLLSAIQIGLLLITVELRIELPSHGIVLTAMVEMYITLLATALAGVAIGLALSSLTGSPDRAMSLTPLLLIPQIVFAGMVFQLEGAAGAIAWTTATRPSLQGLASTARIALDAHGQPLAASTRTTEFLVERWLILLALILLGLLTTVVSLRARDQEGPLPRRLLRALLP